MAVKLTRQEVKNALSKLNIRFRKLSPAELEIIALEYWEDLVDTLTAEQFSRAILLIRRQSKYFPQAPEIISAAMESAPGVDSNRVRIAAPDDTGKDRVSEAQARRNQECAAIFGKAAARVIDFKEATRLIEEKMSKPFNFYCRPGTE